MKPLAGIRLLMLISWMLRRILVHAVRRRKHMASPPIHRRRIPAWRIRPPRRTRVLVVWGRICVHVARTVVTRHGLRDEGHSSISSSVSIPRCVVMLDHRSGRLFIAGRFRIGLLGECWRTDITRSDKTLIHRSIDIGGWAYHGNSMYGHGGYSVRSSCCCLAYLTIPLQQHRSPVVGLEGFGSSSMKP